MSWDAFLMSAEEFLSGESIDLDIIWDKSN